jgi:hypothetical protein
MSPPSLSPLKGEINKKSPKPSIYQVHAEEIAHLKKLENSAIL